MKHKKNGFVATSLVFTYFLVFLIVILTLVRSYISNNNILKGFNDKSSNFLNNDTYSLKLYLKNAAFGDGKTLTNMLMNSDFSNELTDWTIVGEFYDNPDGVLERVNTKARGYLSQEITLTSNHKYYIAINYSQTHDFQLKTYIDKYKTKYITTSKGPIHNYGIVQANTIGSSEKINFVLGYYDQNTRYPQGSTIFKNVLLIDLTKAYGSGFEPTANWVNAHMDWFDGTVNYISYDVNYDTGKLTYYMVPYNKYASGNFITSITCNTADGDTFNINNSSKKTNMTIDLNKDGTADFIVDDKKLEITNVYSDTTCYIEWN